MAKQIDRGKTVQIYHFVREFCAEHGFGPTIREIGQGVGLRSTSTVSDYLTRMTRDGLITSSPGTPRSIQVVEKNLQEDGCSDGSSLLCCKFRFPEGTYPMSVIAMVSDGDDNNNILPIRAEHVEVIRSGSIPTSETR